LSCTQQKEGQGGRILKMGRKRPHPLVWPWFCIALTGLVIYLIRQPRAALRSALGCNVAVFQAYRNGATNLQKNEVRPASSAPGIDLNSNARIIDPPTQGGAALCPGL
jgi:hypothetical protein